jgi:hypothetical protein
MSETPANALLKRSFPQVVFLLYWSDGETTITKGVYAGLADANAAARDLGVEAGELQPSSEADEEHVDDTTAFSWRTAEGVSSWVEPQAVIPRKIARRSVGSATSSAPEGKLYQNEEADDEIDEVDEEGNYD